MTEPIRADAPITPDGQTYHLHTKAGDLAEYCLLVGSPERAEMIATNLFRGGRLVGDHRGLRSYTGVAVRPDGIKTRPSTLKMSVVTTGMGGPTTGIVLPEAVYSGARVFIRVGSCSALQPGPKPGEAMICTAAVRLEGTSLNWAPIEYPAVSDYRVVAALVKSAEHQRLPHHVGIGATTDCFNEGQARPDRNGYLPPRLLAQHEELTARGVAFYSMEEATIDVWCSTHGGFLAGAVDAVYGNRSNNAWAVTGDEEAAKIAIGAFFILNKLLGSP
ncbi:MAG: uridine phosphorylase [bacterium]|nr:uridine phosphorylase [bacterium]